MPKRPHQDAQLTTRQLILTLNTIYMLQPEEPGIDDEEYTKKRDEFFHKINHMSDDGRSNTLIAMMNLAGHHQLKMGRHNLDKFISEYYTIHNNSEQNALCSPDGNSHLPIWHALNHQLEKTAKAMLDTGENPAVEGRIIARYANGDISTPIFLSEEIFSSSTIAKNATFRNHYVLSVGEKLSAYLNTEDLELLRGFIQRNKTQLNEIPVLHGLLRGALNTTNNRVYLEFLLKVCADCKTYSHHPREVLEKEIAVYEMLFLGSQSLSEDRDKYWRAYFTSVDEYMGLNKELMQFPLRLAADRLPPDIKDHISADIRAARSTGHPILPALFSSYQPTRKVDAATQTDIHTEVNHDTGSSNQTYTGVSQIYRK